MRSRAGEAVLVVAAALLITAVMTWPLVVRGGSAGRIDSGDGQFSIWNVAWVARTLVVDPRGLYNANIFYPHRGTLAYSEANIGAGALAVPFYWASGGNPYFAHNAVVFLAFVLALTGTYSLVRHLTGHRGGAAVAAVSYAFCPYVLSHIPHIQLLMTAGIPYSLLALHRYVEMQTAGRASVLGLALAAQALSCGYYGIFAGLLVGYGMVFYGVSRGLWRRWRFWAGAALAAALSIAIVLPFFWPYIELQQGEGFVRSLDDSRRWSAGWRSYVASGARAHRWVLQYLDPWGEVLFPGVVVTVTGLLGLAGLAGVRRFRAEAARRDHLWFYASVAVVALWSSLGPDAGLYAWLYRIVPVFSWLRAPSRLGLVVVLALGVLGGFAVQTLVARCRRAALASAALVALAMADVSVVPLFMVEARPVAPAYESLRKWPYGPVAEFPFFYLRMDFSRHSEYMLYSTAHWRPLINGYSDHIPPEFRAMVVPLSSFPNPESFAILRQLRPQYVIFHLNLYDRRAVVELKARIEQYREYLRPIRLEDPVWLFQIAAWPPER
ncbi:MAG: hypothetical protein MUE61_00040 [Vicinamibacterales bacterium]|jgi:hypothetical protein|nr:hypothetical protein [Vicinamibacterales bacterium]